MSLQLYTDGENGRSALTNLSTQLEAVLTDQKGRVVCAGAGVVPEESDPCDDCKSPTDNKVPTDKEIEARRQEEWILMSGPNEAAYYHVNCLNLRLKPSDSYTLKLRVLAVDPQTPHLNLIPTLGGANSTFRRLAGVRLLHGPKRSVCAT
jgi:hypothetical protein